MSGLQLLLGASEGNSGKVCFRPKGIFILSHIKRLNILSMKSFAPRFKTILKLLPSKEENASQQVDDSPSLYFGNRGSKMCWVDQFRSDPPA